MSEQQGQSQSWMARMSDDASRRVTPAPPAGPAPALPPVEGVTPEALDLLRAIQDCHLSRVETAVAIALVRYVSRKFSPDPRVWWCPWRGPAEEGGVSVRTLARAARYSRRHVQRALVALEARGLIRVVQRVWKTSAYAMLADAWIQLADQRRSQPDGAHGLRLDELLELDDRGRRAAQDLPAAEPAPTVPDWVLAISRRLHVRAPQVISLVSTTIRTLSAAEPTEEVCALEGWRVCSLWARASRPSAEVWARQVEAVGRAARECRSAHWRRLRGELGRDGGEDRSTSLRSLLRPAAWTDHVRAATAHALGECACGRSAGIEGEPAPDPGAPWLCPAGQDGHVVAPADLSAWWSRISAQLAGELGASEWAIWLAPVQLDRVEDGVAWLAVPNRVFGLTIADRWLARLRALVGGPVGFLIRTS